MKNTIVLATLFFALLTIQSNAQTASKLDSPGKVNLTAAEREIKEFFDAYAEDLRQHRSEAIANRYDPRGYYRMGNGSKQFLSFDDNKKRYMGSWAGPKTFAWKDLSIDVLTPDSAVVTGLFDWQVGTGSKATYSYTGVLTKSSGGWRIRVEDESAVPFGYRTRPVSGSPAQPGPFKYSLTARPAASLAPLRHSVETRVTVISGRKFVIMGDLSTSRVQVVEAGASLVIPANTWHVQWWETETVEEIEGVGPMRTQRATTATPRTP